MASSSDGASSPWPCSEPVPGATSGIGAPNPSSPVRDSEDDTEPEGLCVLRRGGVEASAAVTTEDLLAVCAVVVRVG
jgi:hypothetical protein